MQVLVGFDDCATWTVHKALTHKEPSTFHVQARIILTDSCSHDRNTDSNMAHATEQHYTLAVQKSHHSGYDKEAEAKRTLPDCSSGRVPDTTAVKFGAKPLAVRLTKACKDAIDRSERHQVARSNKEKVKHESCAD